MRGLLVDKQTVSRFAQHAQQIFEAAESARECSDLTILMGRDGIRMISDSDWPLDSLIWHHGADAAYRVSGQAGNVRVEGREGSRRCVLESAGYAATARMLLSAR
jgi:hypothetical protein